MRKLTAMQNDRYIILNVLLTSYREVCNDLIKPFRNLFLFNYLLMKIPKNRNK